MSERKPSSDSVVDTYAIDLENFHHVARDILARLYTHSGVAYAELKPRELTGNAFNYHLRRVTTQKLVEIDAEGKYSLSATGQLLLDGVSLETMRLKLRPVSGVMVVIRSKMLGLLVFDSNREPMRGMVGLPFGKLRLGDTLEATLDRVLAKRGLKLGEIADVSPLGIANIRYFERGELVSHRILSVWQGTVAHEAANAGTRHGKSRWVDPGHLPAHSLMEVQVIAAWPEGQTVVEIATDLTG